MRPPPREERSYGRPPTSFARSSATYPSDEDDFRPRGSDPEDDDDAFTAVATGVATDLDMEVPTRREDPRERLVALQQQQLSSYSTYLAVPRPPSRGVQVRRSTSGSPVGGGPADQPLDRRPSPSSHARFSSVHTPWPAPTSASGYDSSDFDYPDDIEPPAGLLLRQRQVGGMRSTPPVVEQRGIARPVSSASSRMQVDEYDSPPYRSGPAAPAIERYERPPQVNEAARLAAQRDLPEDSPIEKELIALLKVSLDLCRFCLSSLTISSFSRAGAPVQSRAQGFPRRYEHRSAEDARRRGRDGSRVLQSSLQGALHSSLSLTKWLIVSLQRLPRHDDIEREAHLKQHWVPIAGSRWVRARIRSYDSSADFARSTQEFRTASHRVTVVFKTTALAAYEAQFLTRR